MEKHIENIQKYGVPVIVTLNSFVTDTDAENAYIRKILSRRRGCEFALSEVWEKGGEGGIDLAEKVLETLENKRKSISIRFMMDELSLKEKIEYNRKRNLRRTMVLSMNLQLRNSSPRLKRWDLVSFPICMAKNQYSLSDDATKLGRPENFDIHIREVYVSAGAGFVVALTGAVMTMPGLPKVPAANGYRRYR